MPKWAALESGYFCLDGSMSIPDYTEKYRYGFISENLSDENGEIDVIISLTFKAMKESKGLTICFAEPVLDFDILAGDYEVSVSDNDTLVYYLDEPLYIKQLTLRVKRTLPHRRVRISQIYIGSVMSFTDDQIIDMDIIAETGIDNTVLPYGEMDLSIVNQNSMYDILNQNGVYRYLRENQLIKPYFGIQQDGYTEYVQMGTYYLKNWNAKGMKATFTAHTKLSLYENILYRYGECEMKNLYDMLVQLFEDDACDIDDSLKEIMVYGYMPVVTKSEALRMMLQAGCCVVLEDETGKFLIRKLEKMTKRNSYLQHTGEYRAGEISPEIASEAASRKIHADNMFSYPEVTQSSTPCSVAVTIHSYKQKEEVELLYSGEVKAGKDIWLEYKTVPAAEVTVAGCNEYKIYANGCYVTLMEDAVITVTGKQVEDITSEYEKEYGGNGSRRTINNPLVIKEEIAKDIADYAGDGYYQKFSADYRGFPYLDCIDLVSLETPYGNYETYITKQNFEYSGYLKGHIEGVRIDG